MLSRLTRGADRAALVPEVLSQPCRSNSKYFQNTRDVNMKRYNMANVEGPNEKYSYFDNYRPDRVYWRLFSVRWHGPREYGKWYMDFSHTPQALELCKHGMVNVSTLPQRAGEHIDTSDPPPIFEKINWYLKLQQDQQMIKWRFFMPKLLEDQDNELGPKLFSANQPVVKVLPGADKKWSKAMKIWTSGGRQQFIDIVGAVVLGLNARLRMWFYEGGFGKEKFIKDAITTYILAHQQARDRDDVQLKDTALEQESGRLKEKFMHYRQLWRCWAVLEKPKILGRYCMRVPDLGNALVVQVVVRLKTREEYVAYDRIGRRVAGAEGERVDHDNVIIFERVMQGGNTEERCWRLMMTMPASEMKTYDWYRMEKLVDDDLKAIRAKEQPPAAAVAATA